MPRAKLFHISGFPLHITHRCHNRDFLLKFSKDRMRWLHWLLEAKKRYGLTVLGYAITSNHIHLLSLSDRRPWVIPLSLQLVASRTAREYNLRKARSGAFWEDHYHATVVENDNHLFQCLVYIELNMVRAGVVEHPSQWPFCGYHEIMNGKERYRIIDTQALMELTGIGNIKRLRSDYETWIESALERNELKRETRWTESVAVGSKEFIERIKKRLGSKANYRAVRREKACYILKEE